MRVHYHILGALLGLVMAGCTLDPEVEKNEPATPMKPEVEILSRFSAEVTVTALSQSEEVSYGAEIATIANDGELAETVSPLEIGKLAPNETYKWLVTNLQPDNVYNARVYISNGRNRKYSEAFTFRLPSTSKATLSEVELHGEMLTATIKDDGGLKILDVGFVAGESPDRIEIMRTIKTPAVLNGSSFSLPLSAFKGGKTYYFVAYAINELDTGYSPTALEKWISLPEDTTTTLHYE